jgi:hypothetical protein
MLFVRYSIFRVLLCDLAVLGSKILSPTLGCFLGVSQFPVPAVVGALVDELSRLGQRRLVAKQPPPVQPNVRHEQPQRTGPQPAGTFSQPPTDNPHNMTAEKILPQIRGRIQHNPPNLTIHQVDHEATGISIVSEVGGLPRFSSFAASSLTCQCVFTDYLQNCSAF